MKHINKNIDKNIIARVCGFTGLSEELYTQMIFDIAGIYLDAFMPSYPEVIEQISLSEHFWSWWKYHWEQRDKEFIESCEMEWLSKADGMERYNCVHDPLVLASAQYLNGKVLEETYTTMIGTIVKNQRRYEYAIH